jgi:hypothetical protein
MAITRYNYDDCRTKKRLQESTGPGRWIMNKPGNGDGSGKQTENPCFYNDPFIRMQSWGGNLMDNAIDIWSQLDGRTRVSSKFCSKKEYPNVGKIERSYFSKMMKEPVKECNVFTEQSRETHPAWMYRHLEQTRWEYPLLNPQENVCRPFHSNIDTRLLERDNYNYNSCKK